MVAADKLRLDLKCAGAQRNAVVEVKSKEPRDLRIETTTRRDEGFPQHAPNRP